MGLPQRGGLGAAVVSSDNVKLNHGHYKVGANWTVSPMLSLRAELFYKDHTNGFYDRVTAGDGYVLGYQFLGEKLTAIVKARSNLTFTTRLIRQSGKMDTTVDSGISFQSNDTKNYNIGETIDWSPSASQSSKPVTRSLVVPGAMRPGQRTRHGTRTPPS